MILVELQILLQDVDLTADGIGEIRDAVDRIECDVLSNYGDKGSVHVTEVRKIVGC
jgi:hypothetical protein